MSRRRKLLAVIAGVALLAVLIVAIIAPLLADSYHVRSRVIHLVKTHTGRDLHIDGDVRLGLVPGPRVTVTDVRLANPPRFAGSDLASLASLALEVELWSLLRGNVRIRGLELRGLVLTLERDTRGRGNWQGLADEAHSGVSAQKVSGAALPAALAVGNMVVRDATVRWRDVQSGGVTTIARIGVQTGALRAGTRIDDVRVRATLADNGQRREPTTLEVRGDVELKAADGTFSVPNFGATLTRLMLAGMRIDATLDTRLDARVTEQRVVLDALRASARLSGADGGQTRVELGTALDFDLARQRLARTDLSVEVPAYAVSGVAGEATLEAVLGGDLQAGTFVLMPLHGRGTAGADGDAASRQAFRFDAEVHLDAVTRTLTAKRVDLIFAEHRASGELILGATQDGMQGGFDLHVDDQRVAGNLSIAESAAGLDVRMDVSADLDIEGDRYALRGRNDLAIRAGVDRAEAGRRYRIRDLQVNARLADPSFADGRLAVRVRADVDVDLNSETVRSNNLRVDVADSRIAGSVEVRRFEAPAVRFDLEADAIDADRLLPPVPAGNDGPPRTAPLGATIAALRALDLHGEMRVGLLTLKGVQMHDIRLETRGGTADQ